MLKYSAFSVIPINTHTRTDRMWAKERDETQADRKREREREEGNVKISNELSLRHIAYLYDT